MKTYLVFFTGALLTFFAIFAQPAFAQHPESGYQFRKIVLDPGHGGKDPGCVYGGVNEKDIVLAVALKLGKLIEENMPGVEVIYTRKTDVFIELTERGNIANHHQADLFLSIHADAAKATSASGSSSWVMGLSREQANLEMAMRENSVITYEEDYQTKYEGFDPTDPVSYIMFSLMQSAYFDQSVHFATLLQKHYGSNTTIPTNRGVKQNILLVLVRSAMPSVLTEIGFLSNQSDRRFMTSAAGQDKIARSLFNAISEYKSQTEGNARFIALDGSGTGRSTETSASLSPPATTGETPAENTPNIQNEAPASNSGTIFRVQVSARTSSINTNNRSRFGAYAGKVKEIKLGNYYKYFIGETDSFREALSLQREAARTFPDAFIVAFENGQPVNITDQMKRR